MKFTPIDACGACGATLDASGCPSCRMMAAVLVAQTATGREALPASLAVLALEAEVYVKGDAVIDAEPSFGCPERSETNACTLTYPHTFHECWEEGSDLPRRPPPTASPELMERWRRVRVLRHLSWRLGCEAESAEGEFTPCRYCGKSPAEGCECLPF